MTNFDTSGHNYKTGEMKGLNILLPLKRGYDNRHVFSFAMQFAKQTGAKLTVLSTYNIPFKYKLSKALLFQKTELEKERIHLNLLDLIGYYQCFYNRWEPENAKNVKKLIKEGSWEQGIISELNLSSDFLLLLNREYLLHSFVKSDLMKKIIQSKVKILSIPINKDYLLHDTVLRNKNIDFDQKIRFERMIMTSEIYNMPKDMDLFRQDILMAN